jgi:hypothetical protein
MKLIMYYDNLVIVYSCWQNVTEILWIYITSGKNKKANTKRALSKPADRMKVAEIARASPFLSVLRALA